MRFFFVMKMERSNFEDTFLVENGLFWWSFTVLLTCLETKQHRSSVRTCFIKDTSRHRFLGDPKPWRSPRAMHVSCTRSWCSIRGTASDTIGLEKRAINAMQIWLVWRLTPVGKYPKWSSRLKYSRRLVEKTHSFWIRKKQPLQVSFPTFSRTQIKSSVIFHELFSVQSLWFWRIKSRYGKKFEFFFVYKF